MTIKPEHYRGSYETRAKAVCDRARLDPTTRCWRCGLTLAEVKALNPRRSIRWQAGHVKAGDPRSALLAEDSLCNERDGQMRTQTNRLNHSRRWADV